jgi:hypothetical protein
MLGYFDKRKAKKVLEKTTKYMTDNVKFVNPERHQDLFLDYFKIEFNEDEGYFKLKLRPVEKIIDEPLYNIKLRSECDYSEPYCTFFDRYEDIDSLWLYSSYLCDIAKQFEKRAQEMMLQIYTLRAEANKVKFLNDFTFDFSYSRGKVHNISITHVRPMDVDKIIDLYKKNLSEADLEYIDVYRDYIIKKFVDTKAATVDSISPEVTIKPYEFWVKHIHLPHLAKVKQDVEYKEIIKEIKDKMSKPKVNRKQA